MSETKVWIVESGAHSDRYIAGIYSSLENAERVCLSMNEGRPESEWETPQEKLLDEGLKAVDSGIRNWSINVLRDGAVIYCNSGSPVNGMYEKVDLEAGANRPSWRQRNEPDRLCFHVACKTQEDAISLAQTKRLELIQSGKWP